jgi:ATP-binding cassette subfamily E protein 1
MTKTLDGFKLNICPGTFGKSEITVLLGQNGTGKSTLVKMFAGLKGYTPDKLENGNEIVLPQLIVSYKPQTITPSFKGTVRDILYKKLGDTHMKSHFQTEIFKPLGIAELMDLDVQTLSGGELQRLAIVLCLGKPADIYLIDEPSAYLDSEQRIIAAKVIKRFIMQTRKTGFIVEHDFIMATYLADRVIYYSGVPSVECTANSPESLLSGMNKFLQQLSITFRRDPVNWRPRINKLNSIKDVEQKISGNYFFLESV